MSKKMKFRFIPTIIFLVLLGLFFNQCDELFNPKDDKSGVAEGSYISTNPTDPEFIKLVTNNGETINVFGTRDANGLPNVVKQINITNEDGEEYSFYYDNYKRISTVIADNGTVFNYEWLSNDNVALNIECNDGINQINTEINLVDLEAEKSVSINENAIMRDPGDRCFDLEFFPIETEEQNNLQQNLKSAAGYGTTHNLYTTSCGAPANQYPYRVYLYDQSGSVLLKELNADQVSLGHYTITVPSGSAPSIDPQAAVEKLTAILTPYCDAAGLAGAALSPAACAYIAAKLALTGIGVSVAPAVGTACAGITSALAIYCATLGASGPAGSQSIMDKINEQKLLENFTLTGNMRLHVRFQGIEKDITKAFNISEGVSSVLNAELSENAKPRINSLNLSPSSPAENQDYTITVSIFCVPIGSTVSISMVGSDGWTQHSDYTVTDVTESAGKYKMTVMGAESGVKDDITAEVRTPDGQTITRSASLIFGD